MNARAVGLVPLCSICPTLASFTLTGPDAQTVADYIFSNDMQRAPGATSYTCMLNARGGTEADLTVSVVEPGDGSPFAPKFEGEY